MEDIPRALEREIARIKPKPQKTRKEKNILIVNDFGEIRSGAFLKVLVCFLGIISLAGGLCSVAFYRLYSKANNQNIQLKSSLAVFEKKVDRLTSEKELLMARLVLTGNTAELEALTRAGNVGQDTPRKENRPGMKGKKDGIESLTADATPDSEVYKGERVEPDKENPAPIRVQAVNKTDRSVGQLPDPLPNVSLGSFSLSSGSNAQDVVVRFTIRNTKKESKEISGRIFCVLKPEGATPDKWAVIPKSSIMKGGVPGPYNKGHYFSISNFKYIQLTINTPTPLKDFAAASVFVFDEKEKLLVETTFDTRRNKQD